MYTQWTQMLINIFTLFWIKRMGFPGGSVLPANAEDAGSFAGLGRYTRKGNGYPVQYTCLDNPMDKGTRRTTVHEVKKSQTQLSDWTTTTNKTRMWLSLTPDFDGYRSVPLRPLSLRSLIARRSQFPYSKIHYRICTEVVITWDKDTKAGRSILGWYRTLVKNDFASWLKESALTFSSFFFNCI